MTIRKIGRYEVRAELGRGGMATVFHAYDPNFERDVAIKVLPEVFLHDPQFRVRFEREAKTIALLEHPAIVPVYDFGESDNQPYIVMRYMAGGTLGDRIGQGAMSLEETARLIGRLSPALDAAHARGVIHRDIKPGNILFDQYGNAFLSDFGIAHLAIEGFATMTGGSALGTPAYMAPEQIQGDKSIDGRADVYAIGVLVYQMLTGDMPYSSDTPAKVMMMHVLQPVPQILNVRPDLPIGCDVVISRAMAKDPTDRFATAGELATELEVAARVAGPGISGIAVASIPSTGVPAQPTARMAQPEAMTVQSGHAAETAISPGIVVEAKPTRNKTPIIAITILGIVIIAAVALFFMGKSGTGPLAMLAPATATATENLIATAALQTESAKNVTSTALAEMIIPTNTPELPTSTSVPTETLMPTFTPVVTPTVVTSSLVLGGSDKVAYLDGRNIWMANLDGSDRVQITTDGAEKRSMQFSNDGKFIRFISGKCLNIVDVETTGVDVVNCFNFTDNFRSFQVSRDESTVALSIDNQLYVLPFDIEGLRQVKRRSDIAALAECEDFAPYKPNYVQGAKWSSDGKYLALNLLANIGGGKQGNVIQIIVADLCVPNPEKIETFPNSFFKMEGYEENPVIQDFAFDGVDLFVLNNNIRNEGFGDMYAYNADLNKPYLKMNPLDGKCCYRDSSFSPDGNYLVFAFQDYLQGSSSTTQIYLIPYGSINTGAEFIPIQLPDILDQKEKPQPILRPAP